MKRRTSTRWVLVVLGVVAAVVIGCGALAAILTPDNAYACTTNAAATISIQDPNPTTDTSGAPTGAAGSGRQVGRWNAEQVRNAAVIVAVGAERNIPTRGKVIAVATAMTESSLVNTSKVTDHDSVGLFQQRPSQGWGTTAQLLDPRYAAGKFYDKLLTIPNWEQLPLAEAAQAVQRSAYPDRYAQFEDDAVQVVAAVGGDPGGQLGVTDLNCPIDGGDGSIDVDGAGLPDGFTLPAGTPAAVVTAIGWALQQLGTPYHYGGDCTAAHSGIPAHQCDCSSLMQGAYRAAGISIPRTTGGQVSAGTVVASLNDIRAGDLVLIPGSQGTRTRPGHVGMYIGQGLIVQAPHTGDVVKISKLSSWSSQVAAVRRIVT
ncbi:C40 family peptidase [Dactylosporangium sp. CA-233914]|uniref:C40 family peptidase n=1 Tax=Dactylosporangium sp. CA-233914 TaxID=3239934 RepID=UPI003D9383CD